MKNIKDMDISELAAFICTHLNSSGIKAVLTGGACVSVYTKNEYESYDLDFIENSSTPRTILKEVLSKIGFYEENRYFKNNETKYLLEFPTGPLSIGSQHVKEINELSFSTGILYLLSPTDCVKDRLAGYYFWDDLQSLEQALNVAKNNKIDIDEVESWSITENQIDKFNKIKELFILNK